MKGIEHGIIAVIEFLLVIGAVVMAGTGRFDWAGVMIGIAIWFELGEKM